MHTVSYFVFLVCRLLEFRIFRRMNGDGIEWQMQWQRQYGMDRRCDDVNSAGVLSVVTLRYTGSVNYCVL